MPEKYVVSTIDRIGDVCGTIVTYAYAETGAERTPTSLSVTLP